MKKPKDVAASVRDRLLRLAQERGDDFQLLLTRYANERLLYRLAQSRSSRHFVLKGAALFTVWTGQAHRATRDLDPGKATQWAAFVRKSGAPPLGELSAVVEAVATFVVAPLAAAHSQSRLERKWAPGVGWTS